MNLILRRRTVFICAAVASLIPAPGFSQSQIQLESAIASGGKNATGTVTIESTIAEPIVASSSGGTYTLDAGFIALAEFAQPPNLALDSVVSRKTHGSAGTFDVDLSNGNGIECRDGGTNNSYKLVFSFTASVTSCGIASAGTLTAGPGPNQCSVDVNVSPGQSITVQLSGVTDASSHSGTFSGTMKVLPGDTNADKFVDSADITQTKSQSGKPVNHSDFREDVNADGSLDSADITFVKAHSGTALSPSAPSQPASAPIKKPGPRRLPPRTSQNERHL